MKTINKKIVILGSTGSVGKQTIEVAEDLGATILALTGSRSVDVMEAQARRFNPVTCVMTDPAAASDLRVRLADTGIRVETGRGALLEVAAHPDADIIFNSIGQSAGLEPTLSALKAGKTLALANKESIVMAGELVMRTARENGATIIPVDSEHSAIFQCLAAGRKQDVSRLLLTASGGPFFGMKREELAKITPERALKHPTWKMGQRITIDSATLMNKGFEVIEALHLFGVKAEQIDVVIHRESIIHSMVEYNDNAVIAQMSQPDMRLCAQYALTYPERVPGLIGRLDLASLAKLTFYTPDMASFPLLGIAYDCAKAGGVLPAVLNAADEVAVSQFLDGYIGFNAISDIVEKTVERSENCLNPSLSDILSASDRAMQEASALCKSLH